MTANASPTLSGASAGVPVKATGQTTEEASTGRIEAFSDNVFSIVITLLILDIRVPAAASLGTRTLTMVLATQWPAYVAYVVSFLLVGGIWANHHVMFRRIRCADHTIVIWNTLHLMCTAVVPFTTALLSAYVLGTSDERRLATLVYSGVLTLGGFCYSVLWHQAVRAHLLEPWVTRQEAYRLTRHWALAPVCYAASFAIAFASVTVSLCLCVTVIAYFTLPWALQRRMGRPA